MAEPENRIFCRLDGLTPAAREQKRLAALRKLGLLDVETVAVFDEATQTAAGFLDVPICILSIITTDQQLIKSAVGLSRVGLMNELAQLRQLSRTEGFCSYVVDSHQALGISDTATNPVFASSTLVGYYGIRAYLGAPLLTADGQCVGTLAVMDVVPRSFTSKDREFLTITARWSLSEFERNRLLKPEYSPSNQWFLNSSGVSSAEKMLESDPTDISWEFSQNGSAELSSTNSIKLKLLTELTQELRRPLTSIMGMASVLNRQIYGSLTTKQKEYLEIIHHSGEHLVSLIEEIVSLGVLDKTSEKLNLTSVDIAMLCQQAMNSLSETAKQHQQQIRLSVEPGSRLWLLDKEKVRQMLYYLLFSLIHSAVAGAF
ncbi:MAG TPA: histidine kinase [Cyanobacteria bacterium UBA11148]|nr:histidine kinase [Cyanobacteria bacterium UBA11148]